MYTFNEILNFVNTHLDEELKSLQTRQPLGLYNPIVYAMEQGGKRIRPCLTLMGYNMFAKDMEQAWPAAMSIEIFHNFTLLHDDIMDNADIRRGNPTVHKKYDENTAILSGDAMSILAYEYLTRLNTNHNTQILQLFSHTALEICEGQQYDMDFENRNDVSVDEYLNMIRLKTAVLLACSLKAGALCADCSQSNADTLYEFGISIGLAFQLRDDLLDTFGDAKTFGKRIGGDIVANKKTFLLLKALELANTSQRQQLDDLLASDSIEEEEKINAVKQIFEQLNIRKLTEDLIETYYSQAMEQIESIDIPNEQKVPLIGLAKKMMQRES
ncbi:polyprenyl synthetase family protein [Puteibacter caeruleilacunae]|nr:polyprenyl synthetase family protein [Puteibacter caeruleilacunae]